MDDCRIQIRKEMERPLVEGYRNLALALGIYLLILMPFTAFTDTPGKPLRIGCAGIAVIILLLAYLRLRSPHRSMSEALSLAALAMTALLGHIIITQHALQAPYLTSDYMIWLVATALVFRRRPWFIATLVSGIAAWLATFPGLPSDDHTLHWVLGITSAAVVATALHLLLGRIQEAQEHLRMEDHIRQRTNEQLIELLADAIENNRTLRGLIPICSDCKKVRNDDGYWQQVEHYISEHSEAQFSHGVCPTCAQRMREAFEEDLRSRDPRQGLKPKNTT